MFIEMNFLQPINTSENYSIIAAEGFRNEIRGLLWGPPLNEGKYAKSYSS